MPFHPVLPSFNKMCGAVMPLRLNVSADAFCVRPDQECFERTAHEGGAAAHRVAGRSASRRRRFRGTPWGTMIFTLLAFMLRRVDQSAHAADRRYAPMAVGYRDHRPPDEVLRDQAHTPPSPSPR